MKILDHFPNINVTREQEVALLSIESFLRSITPVFMLKGYAGTGKTTILKGLIHFLNSSDCNVVLMAPTGRAAKVLRDRTGHKAVTIHREIYSRELTKEVFISDEDDDTALVYYFKVAKNIHPINTVYIVDEASMISDVKVQDEFFRFGTGRLLSDLLTYAHLDSTALETKIIFVGDPCQIGPIGENSSKGFDKLYLEQNFKLSSTFAELTEVKRQGADSPVLHNAIRIRKGITSGNFNSFQLSPTINQIIKLSAEDFLDTWLRIDNNKIIIASRNKTCQIINEQVRAKKYGTANLPIRIGDTVIVSANNYQKDIFNGEFGIINRVSEDRSTTVVLKKKSKGNNQPDKKEIKLKWKNVEIIFPEDPDQNKVVRGRMLENFLNGETQLSIDESKALYIDFKMRHQGLKAGSKEFDEVILADEYFNCLKLKYGYAVTCHKAQGGQWNEVFTVWDQDLRSGYNIFSDKQISAGKTNEGFFRWAYTAVTRAAEKLYVVNPPSFNAYSNLTLISNEVATALTKNIGTKIESSEVILDTVMQQKIELLGLNTESFPIQDHLITLIHTLERADIELCNWMRKGMEISYYLCQDADKAAFKTWINKEYKFNGKFMKIPSSTNSDALYERIISLVQSMPRLSIVRGSFSNIESPIECIYQSNDKFPFTDFLYDDLVNALKSKVVNIYISDVEHYDYRERYSFADIEGKAAVIDFEYNSKGFFGRAIPVQKKSDAGLIEKISAIINNLGNDDY